jgi:hypothetical protein
MFYRSNKKQRNEGQVVDIIRLLPHEVRLHIFEYLSVIEICVSEVVCWEWKLILSDEALWRFLGKRDLLGFASSTELGVIKKSDFVVHYQDLIQKQKKMMSTYFSMLSGGEITDIFTSCSCLCRKSKTLTLRRTEIHPILFSLGEILTRNDVDLAITKLSQIDFHLFRNPTKFEMAKKVSSLLLYYSPFNTKN